MAKNKYKHFNPEEHNINVKIAKVRASSHAKHNINYHIVFIPKFRKAVLVGEKLKEILSTIIKGQCEDLQCELLALEIMPDHIHIFIGARPTSTPSKIVNQIKGNTSRQIRLIFNDIKFLGYEQKSNTWKGFDSLWADGYYCGSAGHVSQESVKRYIQEQEGKKVFEYDIYECPEELKGQLKLGDFFG
jgi:putative transposase